MTEPEINEVILPLAGFQRCTCGYSDCKLWISDRVVVGSDSPDAIDETALRQALGKLSEEQRVQYVEAITKASFKSPMRMYDAFENFAHWLLFEVSTATKARVLAEVVKEGKDKTI